MFWRGILIVKGALKHCCCVKKRRWDIVFDTNKSTLVPENNCLLSYKAQRNMASTSFQAPAVSCGESGTGRPALPGLLGEEGLSAKEKYAERMKKLRDLHTKRNEAR
jgi:hypothetical protein